MTNFQEFATAEERRITRALLKRAASVVGTYFQVNDGEEWTGLILNESGVYKHLATTDSDMIRFHRNGKSVGWVLLIWGNGEDLISDYSDNEVIRAIVEEVV